jgi:hypothetical protein
VVPCGWCGMTFREYVAETVQDTDIETAITICQLNAKWFTDAPRDVRALVVSVALVMPPTPPPAPVRRPRSVTLLAQLLDAHTTADGTRQTIMDEYLEALFS